jgi:hypothetical protein
MENYPFYIITRAQVTKDSATSPPFLSDYFVYPPKFAPYPQKNVVYPQEFPI